MYLNVDCLLHIIAFLSLKDQASLALCCRQLSSLCLNERILKRHVESTYGDFDYPRMYRNLGTWKVTACFLQDISHPVQVLLRQVMPDWITKFTCALPWQLIGVDMGDALYEGLSMNACYITHYPQLVGVKDPFWKIMAKTWKGSPKTVLWNRPTTIPRYPRFCQNVGFFVRLLIQQRIDKYSYWMVNETLDILGKPRSLPSVRNLLMGILQMNVSMSSH